MASATRLAMLSLLDSVSSLLWQLRVTDTETQAAQYLKERLKHLDMAIASDDEAATLSIARGYTGQATPIRPLQGWVPLLQHVGRSHDQGAAAYPLTPLAEGIAYPGKGVTGSPLDERLKNRLEALATYALDESALLSNVLGILHEVGWCLPAPGVPGASFFDQARTAAAVAAILSGNGQIKGKDAPHFLLVIGDLAGIQNHIYKIQSARSGTGALAKRLRARSLEVSLTAEALARDLLAQVSFPITQRLMSAGGRFYLLLPSDEVAEATLQRVKARWEKHSLEQGATLIPTLAWANFGGRDFADFSEVLRRAHDALSRAKLQPLSSQLASPYLLNKANVRPCTAYAFLPAMVDSDVSEQAERDRRLGGILPRVKALTFTPSVRRGEPAFTFPTAAVVMGEREGEVLRNTFDFAPAATPWEVKPLLGHLPTVGDALRSRGWDLETYRLWLSREGTEASERDEPRENQDAYGTLTFGELAALSQGVPQLGALMLDADRMGELFTRGLQQAEVSQIAALSRQLEAFFAGEVANLIEKPLTYADYLSGKGDFEARARSYPLIYSVYAGGDDLFLLGPWDALLDFAQDLNRLYARYTRNPTLSLSGGFALVRPKLPITQISEQLKALEQQAKATNQRALEQQQATGHLALFGNVVPWAELETLQGWAEKLAADLRSDRLSSAQCYRWLRLYDDYRATTEQDEALAMRYKPLLSYALRESKPEVFRSYQDLFNHDHPAWRNLRVWVQWALYRLRER